MLCAARYALTVVFLVVNKIVNRASQKFVDQFDLHIVKI